MSGAVAYERDGDWLYWQRRVASGEALVLRAKDVRPERTGVHAHIEVLCEGVLLGYSIFNIGRDEDRLRLANSIHKNHLKSLAGVYPPEYLKNDLDMFAHGLDEASLELLSPGLVAGTEVPHLPDFRLRPFVLDGAGTIIFAPPGRGKSYTLMLMQVCIDAGVQLLWPVRPGRTLLINLERSAASVADRLGNINAVLGLSRTRPVPMVNARGRSLLDVVRSVERYIVRNRIECVFIDSITRAGADLIGMEGINRVIDTLNRIAPTWVGLAHSPRSDDSHVYGGIGWDAGADLMVRLSSEQDNDGPLGIGLQVDKENDIGKQPMWLGALEFSPYGLKSVRLGRPGEFVEVESKQHMGMKETLRQHLLDVGVGDASELARDLGYNRSNVSQLLNHDPAFIKAGKLGGRQLFRAAT